MTPSTSGLVFLTPQLLVVLPTRVVLAQSLVSSTITFANDTFTLAGVNGASILAVVVTTPSVLWVQQLHHSWWCWC